MCGCVRAFSWNGHLSFPPFQIMDIPVRGGKADRMVAENSWQLGSKKMCLDYQLAVPTEGFAHLVIPSRYNFRQSLFPGGMVQLRFADGHGVRISDWPPGQWFWRRHTQVMCQYDDTYQDLPPSVSPESFFLQSSCPLCELPKIFTVNSLST